MSTSAPDKLFDDISKFIAESRDLLSRGAVMELDGLDNEVRRLCDAAMQLTPDQRKNYADKLQAMLTGLAALGDEMARQRDATLAEMHGLTEYRKAHVAYTNADATDAFGKKKDEHGNG